MPENHSELAGALGTRSSDVVHVDNVQYARAGHANLAGNGAEGQSRRGQDHVFKCSGAHRGQPLELETEDYLQYKAKPEARHAREEQGKDERDAVYRPVLTDSSQGAEGESYYYRYSQSAEGQRQGVGKPKQEFIYNRAGIIPRVAEVALYGVVHIIEVAHEHALIQAELGPQRRDLFRRGVRPKNKCCGVAHADV